MAGTLFLCLLLCRLIRQFVKCFALFLKTCMTSCRVRIAKTTGDRAEEKACMTSVE